MKNIIQRNASNVPHVLTILFPVIGSRNNSERLFPTNVQAIIAGIQTINVTIMIAIMPIIPPPKGSIN